MEKRKTKTWDELTFADNFLFCKILESDPELCRQILELLLGIKINRLEVPQSEKTMREFSETKGVRFDVYIEKCIFSSVKFIEKWGKLSFRAKKSPSQEEEHFKKRNGL